MDMILELLRYVFFSPHFQYIFVLTASKNWHYDYTDFMEKRICSRYTKIGQNYARIINSA